MPLESLSNHIYSSKTDSFALGVFIYYIASKRFPWKVKNQGDLVGKYQTKQYSKRPIAHFAPRLKHLIASLLEVDS